MILHVVQPFDLGTLSVFFATVALAGTFLVIVFFVAAFLGTTGLETALAAAALVGLIPAGRPGDLALRARIGARNRPVWLSSIRATCSGVPSAMTRPPPLPPSGPRSTTQSAFLMTSRLCSM